MANPVATIQAKAAGVVKRAVVETPHQIWTREDAKATPACGWKSSDDDNPAYLFSTTNTSLLVAAVRGEIDVQDLVKQELANRGLDWSGKWIGFAEAKSLAKCFPVRINGELTAVSVPE